jgi:hypothetical protein
MEEQQYKLNLLDEGIYLFAQEQVNLLGEQLIKGSFEDVLAYANELKDNASFIGEGELEAIDAEKLIDIEEEKWFLLIDKELSYYQIIHTLATGKYTLPTNKEAYSGRLDLIFQRIIEIERHN